MNDLYQRLTEGHQFLPFDCGDKDLNEFLEKDAMNYQRGLFAVTYFVDNGEDTIIYFSLSNDKLSSVELTKNAWRKIKGSVPHEKHRKDYPAYPQPKPQTYTKTRQTISINKLKTKQS